MQIHVGTGCLPFFLLQPRVDPPSVFLSAALQAENTLLTGSLTEIGAEVSVFFFFFFMLHHFCVSFVFPQRVIEFPLNSLLPGEVAGLCFHSFDVKFPLHTPTGESQNRWFPLYASS